MRARLVEKNFTYGDLWPGQGARSTEGRTGRVRVRPEDYTKNNSFIDFFSENSYSLYLDYSYRDFAHTDVTNREVVINGNFSDTVVSSLLQHELGHLMLFDVNQFVTVGRQTLRSVIAKVIYTPEHVVKYGMEQLLYTENIIQDIIIETVSNGRCVCQTVLSETGCNAGVKHLDQLENAAAIAEEVCRSRLREKSPEEPTYRNPALDSLIDSMLQDLQEDIKEIREAQSKAESSEEYERELTTRRNNEIWKAKDQLRRLEERTQGKPMPERLERMRELLEEKLREAQSPEREAADQQKAAERKERVLKDLEKKLEAAENLKEALEEALEANQQGEPRPGEGQGRGGEPGEGDASSASTSSEPDGEIHANNTDHLGGNNENEGGSTHTYDCGLPAPRTVTRDESHRNENTLLRLDTGKRVKQITVQDEDDDNVLSNRNKISEFELTYFKPNKKEFSQADMLQGKRKLRVAGINVLIGLDVSGSMTKEWGSMFTQLSSLLEDLQLKLDIERVFYFTYHHRLVAYSQDINDLEIRASGGNAFGYVYQEVMTKLPILQKNELILVTDCGDNLGFPLKSVVRAERGGVEVENHISIIDTENAGFYDKTGFAEEDWSLHRYDEPNLFDALKANLEALIDR